MNKSKDNSLTSLDLSEKQSSQPQVALGLVDAVAVIVGIVIGAGIFETPALVAGNVGNGITLILLWFAGALISSRTLFIVCC